MGPPASLQFQGRDDWVPRKWKVNKWRGNPVTELQEDRALAGVVRSFPQKHFCLWKLFEGGAGESAPPKRKPMGQSRWKAGREAGLRDRSMSTTSVSEGMEAGD